MEYSDEAAIEYWEHYHHVPTELKPYEYPPVDAETLYAIMPPFKGLAVDMLRSAVRSSTVEHRYVPSVFSDRYTTSSDMRSWRIWAPVAHLRCEPPLKMLPKELDMVMDDFGLATTVTHYVAVYQTKSLGPPRRRGQPRKVSIMPVHGYILPLFCSKVRHLPPVRRVVQYVRNHDVPAEGVGAADTIHLHTLRLPVIPIALPDPSTFEIIMQYFHASYTKMLALNLVPYLHPGAAYPGTFLETTEWKAAASMEIARRYTPPQVRMFITKMFWLSWNMVALGVDSPMMWRILRADFELVQLARTLQGKYGWVPSPLGIQGIPQQPKWHLGMFEATHTLQIDPKTMRAPGSDQEQTD